MPTLKEVAQVAVEARRDKGSGSGKRLREIERILRHHRVLSGLTPQEAISLLEDLGPTFVKMGQIAANRSDVIPPAYADAFKRLRADVPPMPFSTVVSTIEASLGHPWQETFSCIEEQPLGSASIAQVHKACIAPHAVGDAEAGGDTSAAPLPPDAPSPGSYVAIKVRRPNVVEQMTQDLALIRQAVALVGLTRATDGIKLSLDDLVAELERTTHQELDFCIEQHNLVRFRQFLSDQSGVESPRPYPHMSSDDVLVMDFVEGPMINDVRALRQRGIDPAKLGQRLAESYVTQIVDNGFFHADPHPGNILVRGDDIVWIDLGMVGELSALERALIGRMFRAVAENDAYALMEALLGAARAEGPVDHGRLLSQLGNLLVSYTTVNLADINVGSALMDVFGVLRSQNLALPPSFTLLARGMVTIEGVLVDIAPDTSVIDIISEHVKKRARTWASFETKARELASSALSSAEAAVHLPTQTSHTLDMVNRGQIRVGADLGIPNDAIAALYSVSGTVAMALISAGLFIGSSLLATTNMHPQLLGVPLLGVLGYLGAFVLGAYVVWRNLLIRHRQKNEEKVS